MVHIKLQVAMRLYPTIILVFTIICPTLAEVLTQSFVIRLKEMEQLIQDQKQVNEDQKQVIESLKSGKYSDERDKESKKYYTTYFIKFISSYPCTFSIKYNKLFFRLERSTKQ